MHQAHDNFVLIHGALAKLAYALIVLHVAAAFNHQLRRRDGVMPRMVPFLRGRPV
jgi:cytochrome b561